MNSFVMVGENRSFWKPTEAAGLDCIDKIVGQIGATGQTIAESYQRD